MVVYSQISNYKRMKQLFSKTSFIKSTAAAVALCGIASCGPNPADLSHPCDASTVVDAVTENPCAQMRAQMREIILTQANVRDERILLTGCVADLTRINFQTERFRSRQAEPCTVVDLSQDTRSTLTPNCSLSGPYDVCAAFPDGEMHCATSYTVRTLSAGPFHVELDVGQGYITSDPKWGTITEILVSYFTQNNAQPRVTSFRIPTQSK